MLHVSNIGGFGLGAFQQGQCADGADFVCGPKTSGGVTINSCRPCDFAQLEAFKDLQTLANSLVIALGLDKKPAIITGPNTCSGGDILALDGRVGPCTTRTITKIMDAGAGKLAPLDPLINAANFQPTNEYIAHALPEIVTYLRELVVLTNAPKNVPAPPQQPVSKTAGGPGPNLVPLPDGSGGQVFPSPAKRKVSGMALTIGILGAFSAVGLVAAGVYYNRSQY